MCSFQRYKTASVSPDNYEGIVYPACDWGHVFTGVVASLRHVLTALISVLLNILTGVLDKLWLAYNLRAVPLNFTGSRLHKQCSFFPDSVLKLFKKIRFSEEGSNAYKREQCSYMILLDYLDECEKGNYT